MANYQAHRGPDGTSVLRSGDGQAVVGMNTLRIVNPRAPIGPYHDPASGLLLTFNGEVYNWRQLASAWGIPVTGEDCDAHLILRAWAEQGSSVLTHLDGMFALAIYDPRVRTLTLARDRLGEKPLYWRLDGGRLAFASEIGALLQYADAPPVGRPEMLATETVLHPDTPHVGIQLLAPGQVLTFNVDSTSTRHGCYWTLPESTAYDTHTPAQRDYRIAVAGFTDLLTEHIPARAPSGDYALLLSGGLDSALLAYLMRPPLCITVRYPGHERFDESPLAARVAADIGAELLVVEPTPDHFRSALPDLIDAIGYPMGNASILSEYAAYAAAAEAGVRVVIGGTGPDELLLGYARHALAVFGVDAVLRAGLDAYRPLAETLCTGNPPTTPQGAYLRLVLRGPDADGIVSDRIAGQLTASTDLGRALTLTDLAISWPALLLTSDGLSSRFGLERRSPYLARELVETAYAMPLSHKLPQPGRGKALLRDVAAGLGLPEPIWRPGDKRGFASPLPTWLQTDLEPWSLSLLNQARDLTRPGILSAVLDRGIPRAGAYQRHRLHAVLTAAWILRHHATRTRRGTADALGCAHAS